MSMKPALFLAACGLLAAAPGGADDEDFSSQDASTAVQAYIDAKVQKDGAFRYEDRQAEAALELQLDKIRMVRRIHGYGYFVDVDFHDKGEPAKPYHLDFWLKPNGGKLDVVDVRIHKAPRREGDAWKLVTRSPYRGGGSRPRSTPGRRRRRRAGRSSRPSTNTLPRGRRTGCWC
jgi:hypothetical protein